MFAYDVVVSTDKPAAVMTQKTDNGNKLKVSLTNPNLGLLASNETYTWSQISGQNSILNRVAQTDPVKLTLAGQWELAAPASNITTAINGANTVVTFNTINGLTIQTELVKSSSLGIHDPMEQTSKDLTVIVAPNPSRADFKVNVTGEPGLPIFVNVFDTLGKRINSLKSDYGQTIVLGTDWSPGIYFVEIRQGKQKKTVKLMKQ